MLCSKTKMLPKTMCCTLREAMLPTTVLPTALLPTAIVLHARFLLLLIAASF